MHCCKSVFIITKYNKHDKGTEKCYQNVMHSELVSVLKYLIKVCYTFITLQHYYILVHFAVFIIKILDKNVVAIY